MWFGKGAMRVNKFNLAIPFNDHEVHVVNFLNMTKAQVKGQRHLILDEMQGKVLYIDGLLKVFAQSGTMP